MNKILRNVCVTALAMIGIIANAQTVVTFVPNETKGESRANASPDKMTKDGITIESTDATFNANGNKHYRFYQNSTTTITSTAGNITKQSSPAILIKRGNTEVMALMAQKVTPLQKKKKKEYGLVMQLLFNLLQNIRLEQVKLL